MTGYTTETLPLPENGATRTCMAATACPTAVLGHDDGHADELLAIHEHRAHGVALPEASRG